MKYALVDGFRCEAETGLRGLCQACGSVMTPKCGKRRMHHWAHRTASCDAWWERETQWHRDWKNEFPMDCQEIRMESPDGDIHIADVQTPNRTVIEFQHSYISPMERRSREAFYSHLVWIIDGMRNPNDLKTFRIFLSENIHDYGEVRGWRFPLRRFKLVDDWITSPHPVYLDFGDESFSGMGLAPVKVLWRIWKAPSFRIVATPYRKDSVINHYMNDSPLEGFDPHRKSPNSPLSYRSMD